MELVFTVGLPRDGDGVCIGPEYEEEVADEVILLSRDTDRISEGKKLVLFLEGGDALSEVLETIKRRKYLNLNVVYSVGKSKFAISTKERSERLRSFRVTEKSISEVFVTELDEKWMQKWENYLSKMEEPKRLRREKKRIENEISVTEKRLREKQEELQKKVEKYEKIEKFISLLTWLGNTVSESYRDLLESLKKKIDEIKNASSIKIDGAKASKENLKELFHFNSKDESARLRPQEGETISTGLSNELENARGILEKIKGRLRNGASQA